MKQKISLKTKILTGCGLMLFLSLLTVFFLSGDNYELLRGVFLGGDLSGEELQEKLQGLGFRGHITVILLSMLQVICVVLPAEPVQVLAGLSFGLPLGLLLCMTGVMLGNTVIYIIYRVYGEKVREYFMKNLDIDFEHAATSDRVVLIILILYVLPAIPYGMICFFAASVGMKYPRFALVTFIGSLPSEFIGVWLGHFAIVSGWAVSLAVFAALLALLALAFAFRKKLFAKVNAYIAKHNVKKGKNIVCFYKSSKLTVPYIISRIAYFFYGMRVELTDLVGEDIRTPCVVLCNHGSFVDFAYAGTLLRKKSPNFIVARLYFYRSIFGKILRSFGCFPKSMFTLDFESTKNCIAVIKKGGMLAMMPEARLSTVGRFEDIQPGTYGFLGKMNVPIYTVVIHGDYLADPKWGKGIRRGSRVEATLELLMTAEEAAALDEQEIRERVEARLGYDEFKWLDAHPEVHYRSRRLAEGLENILVRCPFCGASYTLTTKGRTITCERCGHAAVMDDRYAFADAKPFANFADWYDWQRETLRREIEESEDYRLTSEVEFRLPSKDGKKTLRHAGEGVCTLTSEGLTYVGTKDGEQTEIRVPLRQIYRLLFGAGENFEVYLGSEIQYFVPTERRSAVEWYMASMILWDMAYQTEAVNQQGGTLR